MAAYPLYQPTSQGAGVAGGVHEFTSWRGQGGVSLSPLQRVGAVSADSHAIVSAQAAPGQHDGLGGAKFAAGVFNMTLPPVVPIAGSPRDPKFMV